MAELGTVYVDIKGDWDEFGKNTQSGFKGIAGKAAAAFAGAFVVGKAIDFGKQSVEAASTLSESVNAVQQSFDKLNGEKLLALGTTAAETMGMSEAAFNAFSVRVSGFANQIAGPGGDAAGVVEDLGGRIADFASVMNLDMEQATTVFTQSMAGETEAAKRFGKDVGQAAVQAYALENGLWDGKGAMDAQTLATARLGNLMEQTANVQDDFKNTSGGLANQQRILAAEMENAKASIGVALLPALQAVVPIIRDQLAPMVEKLAPLFGVLGNAVAAIAPPFIELIGLLVPLIADTLTPLIPLFSDVAKVVLALATPIIGLIGKAMKPLIAILTRVVGVLVEALAPVLIAIAPLFEALMPLLDLLFVLLSPLLPIIELLAKLVGAVLGVAIQLLAKYIEKVTQVIKPMIEWAGRLASVLEDGLAKLLPNLLAWFEKLPGMIVGFVRDAATWLVDTGKNLISGFINGIKSAAGRIITAIKNAITDRIPGFVKDALGIASPSKVMARLGREVPLGLAQGITKASSAVDSALGSLLGTPAFGLETYGAGASATTGPIAMTFHGPVGGDLGVFSQQVMDAAAREQRYANG